jgi:8-oxo-dGTP diphosphatase
VATRKKKTFNYDYPRPCVTVDMALVTREATPRVLLIQRKAEPFQGEWAIPGGFVEENERLIDAALRELKEETGLAGVDLEQLHTFGDPGRDPRGWTVSVVYLARVSPEKLSPIAGDDAAAVEWFALDSPPALAFDHADILARVRHRIADRAV